MGGTRAFKILWQQKFQTVIAFRHLITSKLNYPEHPILQSILVESGFELSLLCLWMRGMTIAVSTVNAAADE